MIAVSITDKSHLLVATKLTRNVSIRRLVRHIRAAAFADGDVVDNKPPNRHIGCNTSACAGNSIILTAIVNYNSRCTILFARKCHFQGAIGVYRNACINSVRVTVTFDVRAVETCSFSNSGHIRHPIVKFSLIYYCVTRGNDNSAIFIPDLIAAIGRFRIIFAARLSRVPIRVKRSRHKGRSSRHRRYRQHAEHHNQNQQKSNESLFHSFGSPPLYCLFRVVETDL